MFVDHRSLSQADTAAVTRWLTVALAGTYGVVLTVVWLVVEDPWRTDWVLICIFAPLAIGLGAAGAWLVCLRLARPWTPDSANRS